jgi:hypothetical protein
MLKIMSEAVLLLPTIDGQVEDYVKVGIILLTISGQVEHYVRCQKLTTINMLKIMLRVVLLLLNTGSLQCLKVKDCFNYSTFTR